MILNYQIQTHETSTLAPMVFIHGLFGSLSNLGMLARHFSEQATTIQIDVRNHGLSGHSDEVNYQIMAEDILETLASLNIKKFIAVGHSMGGKIAMKLADLASDLIEKLPALFLRGGNSSYISTPEHFEAINQQFAHAQVEVIESAGHWLHGEKTAEVLQHMQNFIDEK